MRFAFIADRMPTPNTSGAGLLLWSLVRSAAEAGHKIVYLTVGSPSEFKVLNGVQIQHMLQALSSMGVEVVRCDAYTGNKQETALAAGVRGSVKRRLNRYANHIRRAIFPALQDFDEDFGVSDIRSQLSTEMKALSVDAVFVFDDGPIAAARPLTNIRCVAWPSDPISLLYQARWKYMSLSSREWLREGMLCLWYRLYPQWITSKLLGYEAVVHQAAQHAAWFREHGVSQCEYLPMPLADTVGSKCEVRRGAFAINPKPRILHVGHLGGTAAMMGLKMFLEDVLPILESRLGRDNFEVHFVGRVDVAPEIVRQLKRPSIHVRGFVESLDDEFLRADLFMVPIPHPVGSRTRLINGLAYGSCIVAHESCRLGSPELRHNHNVLLASTGPGLAEEIIRALEDPALRKQLRINARQTYEKHFSLEIAGARWIGTLERVAKVGWEHE